MRILLINSEYPPLGGGASNASANLARMLAENGHTVAVITAHFKGLPVEEMQDSVLVRRIHGWRKYQDRSGPREQIYFLLNGCLSTIPFVRSWKPDGIIAFFGVPCGAIAWFNCLLLGTPYIVSLRGGDVPGFRPYDFGFYHRLIGPQLRQVWRRAGAVIANSNGLRELANEFDARTKISVIPNGTDSERFKPVERVWDRGRMLFVGRIVYQKGLDVLFQALAGINDLDWDLTLVGDGNQRPQMEELAASLGLTSRVHFTGWLSGDDLVAQYQKANLYVTCSRHEGMPNVVLEAMASGLPIIASAISGHNDLVIPDINGVLVPGEDPQALQCVLREILSDPKAQQQMGEASRHRAVELYSWSSTTEQYQAVLEQIIAEENGSSSHPEKVAS
jgi:glycogen(starch) synthase